MIKNLIEKLYKKKKKYYYQKILTKFILTINGFYQNLNY